MKKLFYIQPILAEYRKDLARELSIKFELSLLCGESSKGSGFSTVTLDGVRVVHAPIRTFFGGKVRWQRNISETLRRERPELIIACANIRDLTFWRMLLWAHFNGVRLFAHGQGLYSKRKVGWLLGFLYRSAARLSYRYICYTELSRQSMLAAGCPPEKLVVAENSIQVVADAGVLSKTGHEPGVLFVGRLREECNLEYLVDAVAHLRTKHPNTVLHVIGGGEFEIEYRARFDQPWVIFHGSVYDDAHILEISRDCRVGCYPGNAGLSVVHYFALRLPPIVHGDIPAHMGPEPSYVQDGMNGVFFPREQKTNGIAVALEKVWNMPVDKYLELSAAAFGEYERLNSPSLGEKMVAILRS